MPYEDYRPDTFEARLLPPAAPPPRTYEEWLPLVGGDKDLARQRARTAANFQAMYDQRLERAVAARTHMLGQALNDPLLQRCSPEVRAELTKTLHTEHHEEINSLQERGRLGGSPI